MMLRSISINPTTLPSPLFLSFNLLHCPSFQQTTGTLLQSLDQCRSPSSLQILKSIHCRLLSVSDLSTIIKLMRAYSACGHPSLARHLFDQTPQLNIVFFNVMIRGYVNNHHYHQALLLFSRLNRSPPLAPDHYTYPCALKACSASRDLTTGRQLHSAVTKLGLLSNLFVSNSLIALYSHCGALLDSAFRVFDEMPVRDVVSWNAMVAGFAQGGRLDRALVLCREMLEKGKPLPDAGTMASISSGMANASADDVKLVRRVFDAVGIRSLVSWNAMLAVYVNSSMAMEALQLFSSMEVKGIEPNTVTLASVLPACSELAALSVGMKIHDYVKKKRMYLNLVVENALVDMYANCGCLKDARDVFDGMRGRDVVSWTSIMGAYGMHGCGEEAVRMFEQMQESGLEPDHVAFVSVLSACSYSGLVEAGMHYYKCMNDKYMLVPGMEHYACMVDMFGRAGLIEEAYNFIREMPVEANERVWGALLGACRIHSNMSVGLVAADHLFRLVPEQSGYYVLLSNIYARAGRWEDVTSVRHIMASKGMKKMPGCSNLEIGNKVHTFHVGDWSHPQSGKIYALLDVLMARMKEMGYVAETEDTLHDVEEEDKAGHLSVHSEKLAMAFALISTSPGTPIRIRMNLRMCGDCHQAAKLISSICKREFILRDTNRFHHFQHGVCSCGDYW